MPVPYEIFRQIQGAVDNRWWFLRQTDCRPPPVDNVERWIWTPASTGAPLVMDSPVDNVDCCWNPPPDDDVDRRTQTGYSPPVDNVDGWSLPPDDRVRQRPVFPVRYLEKKFLATLIESDAARAPASSRKGLSSLSGAAVSSVRGPTPAPALVFLRFTRGTRRRRVG